MRERKEDAELAQEGAYHLTEEIKLAVRTIKIQ